MKLGCVIMAAGESRRFGAENKLLRTFGGVPLCRRAMDAVPREVFGTVCVVTAYEAVAALAKDCGYSVVINDRPELGVSRTVRLGLEAAADCDGVLFMTADQPLLTAGSLRRLAETFSREPQCIAAAAHDGKRGNPCLFPRDLFGALQRLEGDVGGSRIIRAEPDRLRLVEVPSEELADCDTLQQLEALENRCKAPNR